MAARFYFPTTTGLPSGVTVTPSSFWDTTTGYTTHTCRTTKTNTALADGTSRTKDNVNPSDTLDRIYVSDEQFASGGTIAAGALSAVFQNWASHIDHNGWSTFVVKVVSSDGSTVRGTLYAGTTSTSANNADPDLENSEFPSATSAARGSRFKSGLATTSVTYQTGDRIQIEIGYRATTTSTSRSGTFQYGDPTSGSDMALASGLTSGTPWLELSTVNFSSTQSGAVSLSASTSISASGVASSPGALGLILSSSCSIFAGGQGDLPAQPDNWYIQVARESAVYAFVLEGTGDIFEALVNLNSTGSFLIGNIVPSGAVTLTASASMVTNAKRIIPVFPIDGQFTITNADNTAAYIFVLESIPSKFVGQVLLTAEPTFLAEESLVRGSVALTAQPNMSVFLRVTGDTALVAQPQIAINPVIKERSALVATPQITIQGPLYIAMPTVKLTEIVSLRVAARRIKPPIYRTNYPYPVPEHNFRVIAQHILTREIVDWELPVADDFSYQRQLSGPTIISGSFKPEIESVQQLGLDGYAYYIHVEIDGEIRATGILQPPQYGEESLEFTAEGISAAAHYVTWDGEFTGIQVDAFEIARVIWNHVQGNQDSNYDIELTQGMCGRLMGEPAKLEYLDNDGNVIFEDILSSVLNANDPPRIQAVKAILARMTSNIREPLSWPIATNWTWDGAPSVVMELAPGLSAEFAALTPSDPPLEATAWLTRIVAEQPGREGAAKTQEKDPEPWELNWWEAPNCGESFDKLASEAPFDYVEVVGWNEDKTDVDFKISLGYPRLGGPKLDPTFNADNILEFIPVQEGEETYASEVIVIGAGEGRKSIRGYAARKFGTRVLKTYVLTDKSIKTTEAANATALAELNVRVGKLFEIGEIVIDANHENAPLGSYELGDDIPITVAVPWLQDEYTDWYRITSIQYSPERELVKLGLARSDSFRYTLRES